MIAMNKIVGSLLKELAVAKTISDSSTTEIAKYYEGNDLLRHFPIPRMTIHEVEIDLKFAIDSSAESSPRAIPEDTKKNLLNQINVFIKSIPEADFSGALFQQDDLMARWNKMFSSLMDEINQVFPETTLIEPEKLAVSIGTVVELFIYRLLFQEPPSGFLANLLEKFHQTKKVDDHAEFLNIRHHVAGKVEEIIENICDLTPPDDGTMPAAMNILVEASELESIPLEKVHSLKIKISSADRQLVKIENEDRTILSPL